MIKKLPLAIVFVLLTINSIWAQDRSTDIDRFLLLQVKSQDLKPSDIAAYKITSSHTSSISDVQHTYFRQTFQGIEIVGAEGSVHTKNGKMLQSHHSFFSDVHRRVTVPNHTLAEMQAIQSIAQKMGYITSGVRPQSTQKSQNPDLKLFTGGSLSREDVPVKKIYKQLPFGKIVAAYEISIREVSDTNWFNFFVDATTGEIIAKNNWTSTCGFDHTHDGTEGDYAFAKANTPTPSIATAAPAMVEGTYNVFAQPLTSPFAGDRSIVSDIFDTTASPFGWHDTNGVAGPEFTTTRGNNVNAYEDGDNPGYQPDGGSDLIFDYPFDPVFSFTTQSEDAAITNLFYWNNFIHDVIYLYGMDEASGNFQVNNYGNGGFGGDPVNAEAQDGSGSCNANFQTPPDGSSGTMQMYTCGSRDGDVDNHVVIHEYGHGISNRLTGGGSNSGCLSNDEQMGEGWSDWYGNVLTMQVGDQGTDLRPVGNWLFQQDEDGPGIRDFPYTTDLAQDPRTYDYIKTTSGPHPLGSVWAAMLWEVTWGLIDEHGFDPNVYTGTGGNNMAIALVTEGLKLQPCNPGFVDGRDAILAADVALYGGANQCIIWEAFAKRGLGQSAVQGSSFNRTDGTEAFDSPATTLTTPDEPFCVTDSEVIIAGGLPTGGEYSGPGVTDNGDGITYTFNPADAGVGTHMISYTAESDCADGGTATSEILVKDENPVIECQNITISLDEDGNATIVPEDVVTNFLPGEGYTLDQDGDYNPVLGLTGTPVTLFDDSVADNLPIGFEFTFYGTSYTAFNISSNGFLTFGNEFNSGCCSGDFIPSAGNPNNLIAFAWSDLFPGASSSVRYSTIGAAPNRTLVVDFDQVSFCCSDDPKVTTQIKLFEGSNRIEIHSESVEGNNMTQGIENADGSEGVPVPGRNSEDFTIIEDFVSFTPNSGGFPDNCGNTTTVTLDIDTFTCVNIGENTVTATATDSEGNSASCTAIVTVVSDIQVTFSEITEVFCTDQDIITGLGGGLPQGGVYSGLGVIDDGNGETFSYDPSIAGDGTQEIVYTGQNSCEQEGVVAIMVEVLPAIPQIECQDITVVLDENGQITITGEEVVAGIDTGSLFTLNPFSEFNNVARYDYDVSTDELLVDADFTLSTNLNRGFSLDKNPVGGKVYLLAADSSSDRNLYEIDLESDEAPIFVANITSTTGNVNAQSMSFGSDGTLYFAFNGGEINAYDIASATMSDLATVTSSGATGITYDFENNRLLYATGSFPVNLFAIELGTGAVTSLFSYNGSNGCSGQAIEYLTDGKLIVSGTAGCNTIYTVDLNTEEVNLLANPSGSFTSIKDLLFMGNVPVDNCNGNPLTFTVSPSSFDCTNAGENEVTVTATDENGNTSECTATVTVISDFEVTFTTDESIFCTDQEPITDLGGGLPAGGIYSGTGVTDNGDGLTYTFTPATAGEGTVEITYSVVDICGESGSATTTLEIQSAIPQIECQDITVLLDENGQITITGEEVIAGGLNAGSLFALNPFSSIENIARYDYNKTTDELLIDADYTLSTNISRSFSLDKNPVDGKVYLLAGDSSSDRNLYEIDLESDEAPVFVADIASITGNVNAQSMSFGSDGTLYFAFNGGEINAYDIASATMSDLATVTSSGATGITYDPENNRLIYATNTFPVNLFAIEVGSGAVTSLFSYDGPGSCSGQAIEYLTNGKLIVSGTAGCNTIYTVDLNTEEVNVLANPSGSYTSIKDLLFIGDIPVDNCNGNPLTFTVSPSTFDCSNVGENTVTVIATDSNGNTSECTSTVTVISEFDVTFDLMDTPFCIDQDPITTLGGGLPVGGVYSGAGVTDNGDGETFTFDPAIAGEGIINVIYTNSDACGTTDEAEQSIEVLSALPEITCQDVTVAFDENGIATIIPEQLVIGGGTADLQNELYVLNPFDDSFSIARYMYEPQTDDIVLDDSYLLGTGFGRNFSIDRSPLTGMFYALLAIDNGVVRSLYTIDLESPTGDLTFVTDVISPDGNENPQAMAFASNGLLYTVFQGGMVYALDITTFTYTFIAEVPQQGAVGMAYDYDLNRLLLTSGSGLVSLHEIDLTSGEVTEMFDFNSPSGSCSAQAIEYVGDGKMIAGSTFGCDIIYTVSTSTQEVNLLLDPTGSFQDVKDFYFGRSALIDNCSGDALTVTVSQDTFDCDDFGENEVTVTVSDASGNSVSCVATVTVTDPLDACNLSTEEFAIEAGIALYPNPTASGFTLQWETPIAMKSLELYDLAGRKVMDINLKAAQQEKTVDARNLSSGVYLVKVTSQEGEIAVIRLVKE